MAIGLWTISSFLPAIPGTSVAPAGPTGRRIIATPATKHYWRIAVIPLLPYILQNVHDPTLSKPLLQPYVHPTAPLRILSSVTTPYSGIITVGEVLPPTPEALASGAFKEPHSLRYLRAGHSLLGGVWTGNRAFKKDGLHPVAFDSNFAPLGDPIYSTFVTQEAARLVELEDGRSPKNALVM